MWKIPVAISQQKPVCNTKALQSSVKSLRWSDKWIGELSDMHRVAEIDVGEKKQGEISNVYESIIIISIQGMLG